MSDFPASLLDSRSLAAGDGWSLTEFVCRAGPEDRPFEERHDGFSVAAVLEGQFAYRSERGAAYLAPGALLTGNAGACFRCAHEHSVGDRCVSLNFSAQLAEEAAAAAGRSRFAFEASSLPPSDNTLPMVARLAAFAAAPDPGGGEDLAFATLERLTAGLASGGERAPAPQALETRRVAAAIRLINEDPAGEHGLTSLARAAGLSRYHFLRLFGRATGATPRQYLIQARLRRAAERLAGSREPITAVALESGFGDLSNFNRRFRAVFGVSPRRFRAQA